MKNDPDTVQDSEHNPEVDASEARDSRSAEDPAVEASKVVEVSEVAEAGEADGIDEVETQEVSEAEALSANEVLSINEAETVEPALDPEELKIALESILFVADKPVPLRVLARLAKMKSADLRPLIDELGETYQGRGIELIEVAGGYQFRTPASSAVFVRKFLAQRPQRLSRAQLETLAIVAYRQPVTRPEVDDIRGVDTGSALKLLAERDLIKILGRKEEPGRPLLYGTTPYFLEFFGLKGLKELPTLKEFSELSDESRALFERRSGEALDLDEANRQAAVAVKETEAPEKEEGQAQVETTDTIEANTIGSNSAENNLAETRTAIIEEGAPG